MPHRDAGYARGAYQVAVAFTRGGDNAVLASRSIDGGRTWSAPATLIRDGGAFFNDNEAVTADPVVPGYAYATWGRLDGNDRSQGKYGEGKALAPTQSKAAPSLVLPKSGKADLG